MINKDHNCVSSDVMGAFLTRSDLREGCLQEQGLQVSAEMFDNLTSSFEKVRERIDMRVLHDQLLKPQARIIQPIASPHIVCSLFNRLGESFLAPGRLPRKT